MNFADRPLAVTRVEPVASFGIEQLIPRPAFQTALLRLLPSGPSIHVHTLEWPQALG